MIQAYSYRGLMSQLPLGLEEVQFEEDNEDPGFLSEQLITYIGNKRALLDFIGRGLITAAERLGRRRLRIADLFSGSGIVSRYVRRFASDLISNDLEEYAEVINHCYSTNKSQLDITLLRKMHGDVTARLTTKPYLPGTISELYAPHDDHNIQPGERVFYTTRNAMYLDTARAYIGELPKELQRYFLAPLLAEASVHANTAGVFKGFYKSTETGIGKFGGTNGDALFRIKGEISLPFPIFSNYECNVQVFRMDANKLAPAMQEVDIAYIDPPYNQHPYGSNYFMLNLLARQESPSSISEVSGIPNNWARSSYNKRPHALPAFESLVADVKAKFLLVSFNSEGFIGMEDMVRLLQKHGKLKMLETKYNAFRGSRNLRNRDIHVKEYLYLVEKR